MKVLTEDQPLILGLVGEWIIGVDGGLGIKVLCSDLSASANVLHSLERVTVYALSSFEIVTGSF